MPYSPVNSIISQRVLLDTSKIVRHPATLDPKLGNVKEWKDRATAETEFKEMQRAVAAGRYELHLYEGGHVELKIQYDSSRTT